MEPEPDLLALHVLVAKESDHSAWEKIAEHLFSRLSAKLSRRWPRLNDGVLISDAVTKALEEYLSCPDRYQTDRGTLPVYLEWLRRASLPMLCEKRQEGIIMNFLRQ